ncbi:Hypothetical protein A7982_10708 [Minicystis rosea]|nr:Hypothetical protein A7982_10708 [Minicystis rosea]
MKRLSSLVIAATLSLAGAALFAPGCVISYDDCEHLLTCTGDAGTQGCQTAADCDDHNACTTDTCKAGACAHVDLDGPGPNDGRPCTQDLCSAGQELHKPVAAGTACSPGSTLTCDGDGNCPPCAQNADCGTGDPNGCNTPTCDGTHTCVDMVQAGKKLADQKAGDCMGVFCSAAGVPEAGPDITDAPTPKGLQCVNDICGPDGPYPATAAGTPCNEGGGKVCSGQGQCVECASNADCAGSSGSCNLTTNTCATQCGDGVKNGNETGIDCGGSCPLKCTGTACGSDGECKTGHCANGVCCDGACTGSCQACNLSGKMGTCSNVPANTSTTGCPAPLQSCSSTGACKSQKGGPCTTTSDCQGSNVACSLGACRLDMGESCSDNLQCASGLCDSDFDVCFDCYDGPECHSKSCVADVCKSTYGDPCLNSTDCVAGICTNGICGSPNGGSCTASSQCTSGYCGAGSLCAACTTSTQCGGMTCSNGVCLLKSGSYCSVGTQCNSGVCAGFPSKCG